MAIADSANTAGPMEDVTIAAQDAKTRLKDITTKQLLLIRWVDQQRIAGTDGVGW